MADERLTREEVVKAQRAVMAKHFHRLAGTEEDTLNELLGQVLSLPGREVVNLAKQLELF